MTYITDVIGDDYKKWQVGDTICISSGTGTGKTTFIINELGRYAQAQGKRILYLCNRSKSRTDVSDAVYKAGLSGTIVVTTYQYIQQRREKDLFDDTPFPYIVNDEYHYYLTDASFNEGTVDLYYHTLALCDKCKIYMSATGQDLMDDITPNYNYKLPVDYSYLDAVKLYDSKVRFDIIDNILLEDSTTKVLVFGNQNMLQKAYERYKDQADYIGSRSMCSKLKFCKLPQEIIQDKTFKKRLLFTTRVIDNGVDIIDRDLKHIMIEMSDPVEIVQCIGRKRIQGTDDRCTIYLRQYKTNDIQGIINRAESQLTAATMYLENFRNFEAVYLNQSNKRQTLRQNECFFYKKDDIGFNKLRYRIYKKYHQVLVQIREDGYIETMSKYMPPGLVEMMEPDDTPHLRKESDELKEYLYTLIGQRLYKDEQAELKDKFKLVGLNVSKIGTQNKRPTGIKTINALLDERYGDNFPYRLYNADPITGKEFRDMARALPDGRDNPYRNKRYWMLLE